MKAKFKRVLDFMKANDADSYRVRKALKKAERHANDAEGDKEDSGWRTTENGKHYHIGEGGEIDKGPKAMVGSNVNKPSTWNGGSSTKPASPKLSNASAKTSSKAKEAVMSIQRELMSPGKPALSDFAKKIKERIDSEKGEVSKENLEKIISEEAGKIVTRSDSGILRTNPYYTQKGDEYGTIAASGMQQAISKLNKELGINASIPSEKAKGSSGLTKEQPISSEKEKEMTKAYAKAYQNQLSSNQEKKMRELEAEAEKNGLEFKMTNETAYMQPHALVDPVFELIPKSESASNASPVPPSSETVNGMKIPQGAKIDPETGDVKGFGEYEGRYVMGTYTPDYADGGWYWNPDDDTPAPEKNEYERPSSDFNDHYDEPDATIEGTHLSAPNYSVQSLQDVKNAEIGSTINLPGMPEGSRVWTKWYDGWVSEGGSNISDEEMWDGGNGFIDGADPIQIEPPKESSDPFWQQNVPGDYE